MHTSQHGSRLEGFPQAHVVCQDAVQAAVSQERKPIDSILLVWSQLSRVSDGGIEGLCLQQRRRVTQNTDWVGNELIPCASTGMIGLTDVLYPEHAAFWL